MLYFGNDGKFDVRAMLTFGVSAKESDNAIGYFGTGFKYAVAIILRLGGSISVRSGDELHEFTCSREMIRGKEFDIVKCNGQDAGFTTRLGINWEPWQAFRELWCNCKDEGGECSDKPMQFDTVIAVSCAQITKAFNERHLYFIEGDPKFATGECEIFEKHSHFIFYRGLAVKGTGKPASFAYNIIAPLELTEDRTAKHSYYLDYYIRRALQRCDDPVVLRKTLTASRDTFEGCINFDPDYECSESFISTTKNLLKSGVGVNDSARNTVSRLDEKAGNLPSAELTKVQKAMYERAITVLSKMGMDVNDFEIKLVKSLGDGVMGRVLDGVIYISLLSFNMGTKQLASTLMEEYIHAKHGFQDFDRSMQNWLFDKILSLSEELNGEPI